MRIDIEDIRQIESEIDRLNKLDLSQVELYISNDKITIPEKIIADWKFTGLNNYHFFKDEFYLGNAANPTETRHDTKSEWYCPNCQKANDDNNPHCWWCQVVRQLT